MMENWLVVYDVSADRERLRLAKLLQDYGDRVQHSAFEVLLPAAGGVVDLQQRIRAAVELDADDSIRFYPLCGACVSRAQYMGKDQPFFNSPDVVIV